MNFVISKVENHRQGKGDPTNNYEVVESESGESIDVIRFSVPGANV